MGVNLESRVGATPVPMVLDTSFMIDLNKNMAWALYTRKQMYEFQPEIIIPELILMEFKKFFREGTIRNGLPVVSGDADIESLLKHDETEEYEILSLHEEKERVDYDLRFSRPDVSVIEAARSVMERRGEVAVASGDKDLVNEIEELGKQRDYNVLLFTPWSNSLMEISSYLDIRMLVTSEVLKELFKNGNNNSAQEYIYVARDTAIRGQGIFDIAFSSYTYQSVTDKLPRFGNVYPLPVVRIHESAEGYKNIDSHTRFLSKTQSIVYSESNPNSLGLVEVKNPLKPHERVQWLKRVRNSGISKKEHDKLFEKVRVRFLPWAHIPLNTLHSYDTDAFRTLQVLKNELDTYPTQPYIH